jgi:transcriptional regulator with XRE-family HTH domain
MNYGEKIMKIFGIRVKQELKEQGKLQKDLCEYLKVNKSTLSEWLNDNNEPSMQYIVEIATFLGVSTDYLLGLEQ